MQEARVADVRLDDALEVDRRGVLLVVGIAAVEGLQVEADAVLAAPEVEADDRTIGQDVVFANAEDRSRGVIADAAEHDAAFDGGCGGRGWSRLRRCLRKRDGGRDGESERGEQES